MRREVAWPFVDGPCVGMELSFDEGFADADTEVVFLGHRYGVVDGELRYQGFNEAALTAARRRVQEYLASNRESPPE